MKKQFINYSILNFTEKFLAYIAPLLVLKFLGNKIIYNQIELIYSYSLILSVLLDFGIKGYFIYSFRFKKNLNIYAQETKSIFNFLILIYFLIIIIFFSFGKNFLIDFMIIYIAIFRSIFLVITNFYRVYFRIIDVPQNIFLLTIPISLIMCLCILGIYYFNFKLTLIVFFSPVFFFLIIYFVIILFKLNLNISKLKKYLLNSIQYYYPIIIISIISIFIGNYVKIFTFYNFESEQMTKISFYLRFFLLIQLAHASFASFFMKSNFILKSKIIDKKLLKNYVICLLLFTMISISLLPFTKILFNLKYNFDLIPFFLILYVIFWCIGAYFEQFLNKFNENKKILKYYLLSLLVYLVAIYLPKTQTLEYYCFAMALSSLVYLILTIFKIKSLNFKII